MELVKPVEPVLWASIVELVIGGTGYGTVEALVRVRPLSLHIKQFLHLKRPVHSGVKREGVSFSSFFPTFFCQKTDDSRDA